MIRMCLFVVKTRLLNAKAIIAILLGSIPLSLDAVKLIAFSKHIGEPLNILDGIIYSTSNMFSMALASLGAIILLLANPPGEIVIVYDVFRISRKKWMIVELGSLAVTSIIYYIILFAINMLIISPYSFLGNIWSDTMYTLAYSNPDLAANLFGLGLDCPQIMLHLTPLTSSAVGFILSVSYVLLLTIILFFMNMNYDKPFGIFLVSLIHMIGYFLKFRYSGNALGYLSFLGNSILTDQYFTKPFYTTKIVIIFSIVILSLLIAIYKSLIYYDFKVTVGAKS